MKSAVNKRREMWKAIDEIVTTLEGFSPGERGVVINAAQQIIGITEVQAIPDVDMLDEDD